MTLTLAATLAVLVPAVIYAATCWAMPFTSCRNCAGTGYRPARITRKLRQCRRCAGVGTRLRTGRALFNTAARIHHDATTTTMPAPPRDPAQAPIPRW